MAQTNVPGWKVRYALVKESSFKTAAAPTVGGADQQLLPLTSESVRFNWSQQMAKYAGMGRAQASGGVYNTEIAPQGDLQLDVTYMSYQALCQAHFAGGVVTPGTVLVGVAGGTMYTYVYQTGTVVNKQTSYSLHRILGTATETDQFLGGVPDTLTFAGNTTDPLKLTASMLFGDGTHSQSTGAGTIFTFPATTTFKPYVAYNGVVTLGNVIVGTVKSWSLTSANNMTGQMALDGARGVTDFLMGEHAVTGQFVADMDTNESAKALLFNEGIGTATITYYGSNATIYQGTSTAACSPDLTFQFYFRVTDANTPYGGPGPVEQTVTWVGVNDGAGYALKITGTSLSGTYHNN